LRSTAAVDGEAVAVALGEGATAEGDEVVLTDGGGLGFVPQAAPTRPITPANALTRTARAAETEFIFFLLGSA
jgi:hypothetical protein